MDIAKVNDAKQARVRCGPMWLFHLFTIPPVVSIVYASKTGNWIPTLAATGAAVVALPIAMIDLGFTLAVAPPITSAVLFTTAATSKRNKLGIIDPLQADQVYLEALQAPTSAPPVVPVTGTTTSTNIAVTT